METPVIKETFEYSLFKILHTNRDVNPNYVSTLVKSIQKHNLLPYNPIIVNERMEVIDGQHRLVAAKRIHVPIYYVVAPNAKFEEIVLLNANLKQWRLEDYLKTYVRQGKRSYIELQDFSQHFHLSISNAMALLSITEETYNLNAPYNEFKSGEFIIKSMETAQEIADAVNQMAPYSDAFADRDRDFINAVFKIHKKEEVYLKDLIEKVKSSEKRLQRQANVMGYLRQFEDVYNVYAKNRTRFY